MWPQEGPGGCKQPPKDPTNLLSGRLGRCRGAQPLSIKSLQVSRRSPKMAWETGSPPPGKKHAISTGFLRVHCIKQQHQLPSSKRQPATEANKPTRISDFKLAGWQIINQTSILPSSCKARQNCLSAQHPGLPPIPNVLMLKVTGN